MEIKENKQNDIIILGIVGRLDSITSSQLGERFSRLMDEGNSKFVFDLSELNYISSAGLRVFLAAAKRLENIKGRIVLCGLRAEVKDVFEISGFTPIFQIFPTRDEAAKNIQS